MGEQLLQNLGCGAVDRGGRDTVKIGAAPPVVSAPPGDHVGHDFVDDVSQSLALQVRTGHQSVEVGESLICADLVLSHLVEIAHTRRVYEQIRGVRQTALQQRPPSLSFGAFYRFRFATARAARRAAKSRTPELEVIVVERRTFVTIDGHCGTSCARCFRLNFGEIS